LPRKKSPLSPGVAAKSVESASAENQHLENAGEFAVLRLDTAPSRGCEPSTQAQTPESATVCYAAQLVSLYALHLLIAVPHRPSPENEGLEATTVVRCGFEQAVLGRVEQ